LGGLIISCRTLDGHRVFLFVPVRPTCTKSDLRANFRHSRSMAYVPPTRSQSIRNPFLADSEIPAASRPTPPSPELKEFTYELLNKSNKPWATLSLLGDAEHSKTIAAFVEGSPVTGEVRLDLESGDAIHAVVLSVRPDTSCSKTRPLTRVGRTDKGPSYNWVYSQRDGHFR
jgi:hypothetical protein